MDVTLKAALIAAIVSVVLGLVNMILTIHRNKQDGITAYRMQWIKELQEEYAKILSWSFLSQDSIDKHIFRTIDDLQNSVYKVSFKRLCSLHESARRTQRGSGGNVSVLPRLGRDGWENSAGSADV